MAKINVLLGAHDIAANSERYRDEYTCTKFIKHPNWHASNPTANNIGLIKLPNAINFTGI